MKSCARTRYLYYVGNTLREYLPNAGILRALFKMVYLKLAVQYLSVVQQTDGTLDRCVGRAFVAELHHVIPAGATP